jgi:hypothetical protein
MRSKIAAGRMGGPAGGMTRTDGIDSSGGTGTADTALPAKGISRSRDLQRDSHGALLTQCLRRVPFFRRWKRGHERARAKE